LFFFFIYKDCTILLNFIKNTLERLNLKFHKTFFNLLFNILNTNLKYLFFLFNCKGIKISINGKIGASGSAKTKNISLKLNKNSTNNKNLKLDYQKTLIKTKSGVFGVKLFLCY